MDGTKATAVGLSGMLLSNAGSYLIGTAGPPRLEAVGEFDIGPIAAGITILATAVGGAIAVVGGQLTRWRVERQRLLTEAEIARRAAIDASMKDSLSAQIERMRAEHEEQLKRMMEDRREQLDRMESDQSELAQRVEDANDKLHDAKNQAQMRELRHEEESARLMEQNRILMEQNRTLIGSAEHVHQSNIDLRREIEASRSEAARMRQEITMLQGKVKDLTDQLAAWESGEHPNAPPAG